MSISSIGSASSGIPLGMDAGVRAERPQAAEAAPASAPNVLPEAQTVQKAEQSQKSEKPRLQDVEQAARKVENFVKMANSDLQFAIDRDTDQTVVKVIDRGTKEVIRQFPSEEMLQISKSLDKLQGLLVKQQA